MADYITGRDLNALYYDHESRYTESQRRIQAARDLLAGKLKAPLDENILPGRADREALRASLAQKYTMVLKLLNKLVERRPELVRYPVGTGQRAMAVATKIEQIANAMADQVYPDDAVADLLLNEGEAAVVTMPAVDRWDALPSMLDDGGEIKRAYRVDGKGRGEDDEYYREPGTRRQFRASGKKSAEYFQDVDRNYRARNLPIVMEAVSRLEMIPINPRREGRHVVVDGLIRKRQFMRSDLYRRGYRWGNDRHMEPADPQTGGDVEMLEAWLMGPDGPYVSYCIEKSDYTHKDGADAVVDLGREYGLTELPVAYDYGWSFPGVIDPDQRGVPFANVFGRSWLNLDALFTSLLIMAFREANMFLLYKPDLNLVQQLAETGKAEPVKLQGNAAVPLLGDLQRMGPSAQVPQLESMIQMLSAKMTEELPTREAFGGGSASAIGRNVAEEDALGTVTQVRQGQLRIKEQAVRHALEMACAISKKRNTIMLFVNSEIPVEQRAGRQSTTRSVIEVDPALFGEPPVYDVDAVIPGRITDTDKLALRQQLSDAAKNRLIPHEWLLEHGYSDAAPNVTIAKILEEDAMLSPEGRAMILRDAALIAGDEETAVIMKGIADKVLMLIDPTAPPSPENVMPSSMLAGMQGVGASMPGVAQPNLAASQLGGVVAGAMNATPAGTQGALNG